MALSGSVVVQIAFDTAPAATPTWTTVTTDARWLHLHRGRSNEFDHVNAGTLDLVLDNSTRKYDPTYTAGAYYGKLKPMKRIRVGFTYGATTYYLFYGYVNGWPQAYNPPHDAVVNLSATDAFKVFARSRLPSAWEQQVRASSDTVKHWFRLGDPQEATTAADALDATTSGTIVGAPSRSGGLVVNDSDGGLSLNGSTQYVVPPATGGADFAIAWGAWVQMGTIATAERQTIIHSYRTLEHPYSVLYDASSIRIVVLGTDYGADTGKVCAAGTNLVTTLSAGRVDDGQPHLIVVNDVSGTIYVDGVASTTTAGFNLGGSSHFTATGYIGRAEEGYYLNGTVDEVMQLDANAASFATTVTSLYTAGTTPRLNDTPKARIDWVLDYLGWPSADRDIDTGRAVLLAARLETDALSHLHDVADTEGGRLFINRNGQLQLVGRDNGWGEAAYTTSNATFGDGAGELRYSVASDDLFDFDDERIINEARVRQVDGVEHVVVDTTSQDDYYAIASRSETSLDVRPAMARGRAEYLVSTYKDPQLRVPKITVKPERDPANLYPVVLAADLGYRYTIRRRPQNIGSAVEQAVQLEGIDITINPQGDFTVTWELSPAEPSRFRWGAGGGWGVDYWGY